MRLNAEAVVCTGKGKWYYGSVNGFQFFSKSEIKDISFFKEDIARFIPISQWIKELGYGTDFKKLTRTILKTMKVIDTTNKKSIVIPEKGALKLFIGRTILTATSTGENYNVLCANCIWTCRQPKSVEPHSCKAFKNGNPE